MIHHSKERKFREQDEVGAEEHHRPCLTWSYKETIKTLAVHQRGQTVSWSYYALREHLFKEKGMEIKTTTITYLHSTSLKLVKFGT